MTDPAFREVDRGPLFESYQGPGCAQRLDWTRQGVVRSTIVGQAVTGSAESIVRRCEVFLRAKQAIILLHDAWDCIGYDTGFRHALTNWAQGHPGAITEVHVVTRSKLVSMGISVTNLVLPGLMKGYSKR